MLRNHATPQIGFYLKIVTFDNDNNFINKERKYCYLLYEIKNNTNLPMFFNRMNIYRNISDTSGKEYNNGYFNVMILQDDGIVNGGCITCKINQEYDIYPLTVKDTLLNIIRI